MGFGAFEAPGSQQCFGEDAFLSLIKGQSGGAGLAHNPPAPMGWVGCRSCPALSGTPTPKTLLSGLFQSTTLSPFFL